MTTRLKLVPTLFAGLISAAAIADTGNVGQVTETGKAGEPSVAAIAATLKHLYPKTTFTKISQTPMSGVYEVVMGKNVAYVEETGRYFLFGHLYDMKLQRDLTEDKAAAASALDFDSLPKQDAVVTVKGKGTRKIAVFSDPDCPYCKKLETETMLKLDDVTIYTFLFPIDSLHPDSRRKAVGVWCAKDQAKAWENLMLRGVVPVGDCENPIERNVSLAARLGINGTPTIVLDNGRTIPGAMPVAQLQSLLTSSPP